MLKITVFNEDKNKVKNIIAKDSFFKYFNRKEVEDGFELDGMRYCIIDGGSFILWGSEGEPDRPLKDVISDVFREVPGVELKGDLELGDDNYRQDYWIFSEAGSTETTVDFAAYGGALSDCWFVYDYDTDYGGESIVFNSPDEFVELLEDCIEYAEKFSIKVYDLKTLWDFLDAREYGYPEEFYGETEGLQELFIIFDKTIDNCRDKVKISDEAWDLFQRIKMNEQRKKDVFKRLNLINLVEGGSWTEVLEEETFEETEEEDIPDFLTKDEYKAVKEIIQNSNGRKRKYGDFIVKNDYGSNVYYRGKGGEVVIPEEIGGISMSYAFDEATGITSLRFPGTTERINWEYFRFGSKDTIEKVVFDEGLKVLHGEVFANCKNLREVSLPSSLRYLDLRAFQETPWYREHLDIMDYEFALTLYGSKEQLDKMLEVYQAYHGDRNAYFICDKISRQDGQVQISAFGPYGDYKELKDVSLFCELSETVPDARFEGMISGNTRHKIRNLECELKDEKLYVSAVNGSKDETKEAWIRYFMNRIPLEQFKEIFEAQEEEIDEELYREILSTRAFQSDFDEWELVDYVGHFKYLYGPETILDLVRVYEMMKNDLPSSGLLTYPRFAKEYYARNAKKYIYDPVEKKYVG